LYEGAWMLRYTVRCLSCYMLVRNYCSQELYVISWKHYTGWTQKHSLISSSYKIKTYWNIFINMGLQIHSPFKRRVKSHLPSSGIIRNSPYSPR
jgi:hypothetical protein